MHAKLNETDIRSWLQSTMREVQRVGDKPSVCLRCHLYASLESVWAACTNRDPLRQRFRRERQHA